MDVKKEKLFEIQVKDLKNALAKKNAENYEFRKKKNFLEIQIRDLKRQLRLSAEQTKKQSREISELRIENGKMNDGFQVLFVIFFKQNFIL